MKQILIICISFVCLLVAISIYYHLSLSKQENFKEADLKIMLFYATWCPHCERYLQSGVFDTFDQKFSEKYNVRFIKYDYDKNKTIGDKYRVSGFPSIVAEDKSGMIMKFDGDRDSTDDMEQFIKKALA